MAQPSTLREILSALRRKRGPARTRILFTRTPLGPEVTLALRVLTILMLILAVLLVFWLDREGLHDNLDGHVSFRDIVYFTMVTITTVGYGDIVPVSDRARLIDAIFVTPVRIFVWFLFLGTAYQFLIKKVIEDLRMTRLQKDLKNHILVLGFGGSGTTAVRELIAQGVPASEIVVVDAREAQVQAAADHGCIGLNGDATREELLRVAGADRARATILALGRDDTTVLAVLTLRTLNRRVRIVATVQESENRKLVRQSGADAIVAPFQVGGFLLADAVTSLTSAELLTDLLSCEGDMSLVETRARPDEVGRPARELAGKLVLAIRRDGLTLRFWESGATRVQDGDVLISIAQNDRTPDIAGT